MALNDYKIGATDVATYGVQSAPDKLTGTAQQNKAVFDQFISNKMMALYNGIIDALQATTAAGEIGYSDTVTQLSATKVQTAIATLKTLIDGISPSSITNMHFKDVSINETTGVFTFTREDNSTKTIDTLLEKVATNFTYNAETKKLILTLKDGTTQEASLSDFVQDNMFEDTSTIDFDVVNHVVKASIKSGSITDAMLNSTLVTTMQGYVTSCSESASTATTKASEASTSASDASDSRDEAYNLAVGAAQSKMGADSAKEDAIIAKQNAQVFATNASNSATTATNAATTATTAKNDAVTAKDNAQTSASNASSSATSAGTSATNAGASALVSEGYSIGKQNGTDVASGSPYYHNNAKYYSEQASQAAGADMMKSVYDTQNLQTDIFQYAEQKGKITIGGTAYTVVVSTTDAGTEGCITFVVDA